MNDKPLDEMTVFELLEEIEACTLQQCSTARPLLLRELGRRAVYGRHPAAAYTLQEVLPAAERWFVEWNG